MEKKGAKVILLTQMGTEQEVSLSKILSRIIDAISEREISRNSTSHTSPLEVPTELQQAADSRDICSTYLSGKKGKDFAARFIKELLT